MYGDGELEVEGRLGLEVAPTRLLNVVNSNEFVAIEPSGSIRINFNSVPILLPFHCWHVFRYYLLARIPAHPYLKLPRVASSLPHIFNNSTTMRWPPWSKERDSDDKKGQVSWTDSLNATDWSHYTDPRTIIPTLLLTTAILASVRVYRTYLRRIPEAGYIRPGFFRRRSLFGIVTRVGDGDNFHLFHTPGGRLAGWGWMPGRKIPKKKSELKDNTVCQLLTLRIRLTQTDDLLADSHPYSRNRRARRGTFWKARTAICRRSSSLAQRIHPESTRASLHLQEGSVRPCCGYGMGAQVWSAQGCRKRDAEGRTCYCLRGENGSGVWGF